LDTPATVLSSITKFQHDKLVHMMLLIPVNFALFVVRMPCFWLTGIFGSSYGYFCQKIGPAAVFGQAWNLFLSTSFLMYVNKSTFLHE